MTTIKAWMSSNFGRITLLTSGLAALERLKKRHIILLALFFILAGMEDKTSSKFGRIRQRTGELAALERLKKLP